ncbi:hypothetical protein ACTHAL_001421 [Priestia flexa]|uniref:hypothetical protein n=1 Tax=Priestia flexa TaxID=86664 RepID=UPI003F86C262
MFFKKSNSIIKQAVKEVTKINKEFEEMSIKNEQKSQEIKTSIQKKSVEFQKRKEQRKPLFDTIRSKRQ